METTIVLHRLFEYNITDSNVLLFVGRGITVRYVAVITVVFGQLFGVKPKEAKTTPNYGKTKIIF